MICLRHLNVVKIELQFSLELLDAISNISLSSDSFTDQLLRWEWTKPIAVLSSYTWKHETVSLCQEIKLEILYM